MRPAVLANAVHSEGEPCTVPDRCTLLVELRTIGPDEERQVAAVVEAIDGAAGDAAVAVTVTLHRRSMELSPDHPFLTAVVQMVGGEPSSAPYWTDAALHHAAGTAAVVLGPTGEGLHEHVEWVTEASLVRLTGVLGDIARWWCGPPA